MAAQLEIQDGEPDPVNTDLEAEEWDEETLGLDWSEADEQSLLEELVSRTR